MKTLQTKKGGTIAEEKLKPKWAKLMDDDRQCAEGLPGGSTGPIQQRAGETPEAFEKAIKEIFAD